LKNTKSPKNTKSLKNAKSSNKAKRAPPSEKAVALAKKVANANAKKAAGHAKAAAFARAAAAANPTSSSKDKGAKRKVSALISHTNESNTDNDVMAVDSGSDAEVYTLIKPCGKTSKWWAHYSLFHQKHSDMRQYARCNQIGCEHDVKITQGTGGLSSHLKHRHRSVYDKIMGVGVENQVGAKVEAKYKSMTDFFPGKLSVEQISAMYLSKATWWSVNQAVPLSTFDHPSYRAMFDPFHSQADKIVAGTNRKSVRESTYRLGVMAKDATRLEMESNKGSWTCDHWTGPSKETYTTTTYHYIDADWNSCNCMLDFKVFHGSTTGDRIYEDQTSVLDDYTEKPFVVMGVTDTTGNMGVLGKHLRDNGMQHGYCTDHSFNLNGQKAFHGKHLLMIYCSTYDCIQTN